MQVIEQLKSLSEARFHDIYQSLERDGFGPLDGEVAKALRFRPQAIRKLPMVQRARRARSILERSSNAELCYELFGSYLLKHHKELVTSFLDATGVPHKDGMIEDLADRPDGARVAGAVEQLDGSFEPEDVTLYLSMCVEQWPQVSELEPLWRKRLAASEATA
jgi:hypothetical protein